MLSQAVLDNMAAQVTRMYGSLMEKVTYYHQDRVSDPAGQTTVFLELGHYSQRQVDGEVILKEDRPAWIPTSSLGFTPMQEDHFVRANGEDWKIIAPDGGPGYVGWTLQSRKVG
jgi:hypothetical protein